MHESGNQNRSNQNCENLTKGVRNEIAVENQVYHPIKRLHLDVVLIGNENHALDPSFRAGLTSQCLVGETLSRKLRLGFLSVTEFFHFRSSQ